MIKHIFSKSGLLVVVMFFAFAASYRLFTNSGFSFHDETQIANLFEYKQTIASGQFPPRWSPDVHFTYGSPYPIFNYQLPYLVSLVFNKFGFSLFDSYKLSLALSIIVGSIGAYYLGLLLATPSVAIAGAIFYTLFPYHAVDVYVRGTIGESFALGILPWIFYWLYRLFQTENLLNLAMSGITMALLLLSHQPTASFGLPFIFLFFILYSIQQNKLFSFVKSLVKSLMISVSLSAYYLIPLFAELKNIIPVAPFNFYDHFPFVKQLIYSPWGYGASIPGPYDGMSFQLGFATLLIIFVSLVILVVGIVKKQPSYRLLFLWILAALNLFLLNNRSTFIWEKMPFTNQIQFPWRLIGLFSLISLLLFFVTSNHLSARLKPAFLSVVVGLSIFVNLSYFHPGDLFNRGDSYFLRRYLPNQVLTKGEKVSKEYLDYTENYMPLPIHAQRPENIPVSKITAESPKTSIVGNYQNPFLLDAVVNSPTGDFVSVNNFYYPGWNLKIDGKSQKILLGKYGQMVVFVPAGTHKLQVEFSNTLIRLISNIISLVSISGLACVFFYYLLNSSAHHRRSRS